MADRAPFDRLLAATAPHTHVLSGPAGRLAVCPTLGGRVFTEVGGVLAHRLDLAAVMKPDARAFNNYGGNSFWPAPEGGAFGFNYRGAEWYVQPAINTQPYEVVHAAAGCVHLRKQVELVNRAGAVVRATMERVVELLPSPRAFAPAGDAVRAMELLSYATADTFIVDPPLPADRVLIAAWSLEQFVPSPDACAFVCVGDPATAVNDDYYEPPRERLALRPRGLLYRTDGRSRGQIGIRADAQPACIGFADSATRLVGRRENRSLGDGRYFNIADNEQPEGPFSAADAYSIFNSGPDMTAFELETVGGARIEQDQVSGSRLISVTTLGLAADAAAAREYIEQHVG